MEIACMIWRRLCGIQVPVPSKGIVHVKQSQSGTWLCFDDEHVSSLEDDEYFGNAEARQGKKEKEAGRKRWYGRPRQIRDA